MLIVELMGDWKEEEEKVCGGDVWWKCHLNNVGYGHSRCFPVGYLPSWNVQASQNGDVIKINMKLAASSDTIMCASVCILHVCLCCIPTLMENALCCELPT